MRVKRKATISIVEYEDGSMDITKNFKQVKKLGVMHIFDIFCHSLYSQIEQVLSDIQAKEK